MCTQHVLVRRELGWEIAVNYLMRVCGVFLSTSDIGKFVFVDREIRVGVPLYLHGVRAVHRAFFAVSVMHTLSFPVTLCVRSQDQTKKSVNIIYLVGMTLQH